MNKKRKEIFDLIGRVEWVRVKEWEREVGIKNLTVNDRIAIGKYIEGKPKHYAGLALVAVGILDSTKTPYFELSEECLDEMAEKIPANTLDFLASEVMRVNGMTEEHEEEAKKN